MNTTEKHYQDWFETYVALALEENKSIYKLQRRCLSKQIHTCLKNSATVEAVLSDEEKNLVVYKLFLQT